jgi:hypothetical protein
MQRKKSGKMKLSSILDKKKVEKWKNENAKCL